jgi:hypothetical protein
VGNAVLLANPRFILPPQFYGRAEGGGNAEAAEQPSVEL